MERERRRESRESQTLQAMFPMSPPSPQLGGDPEATRIAPRVSHPRPADRLPTLAPPKTAAPEHMLIVPARSRPLSRLPATSQRRRSPIAGSSRLICFMAVLVTLGVALGVQVVQTTRQPSATTLLFPGPSGHGPWTASSGSVVVIGAVAPVVSQSTTNIPAAMQPCHDATMFPQTITQWSVPPGCYGMIYQPNPANYVQRPGFGWCNWWVRVTHPSHPDITENGAYARGADPVAGAAIFFDGNEQGADSEGHWAVAVAVAPDHYWVLISEMNFAWRGAGWGKLDYRYIHVSPHVHFLYIFS